ncbi:MAG: type II toxin-antitoxin system prevent-host-death family antitoxin [Chloroflexota bacterium]
MSDRIMMASRFKAECLAVLDQVDELKVSVTITKHGRPIARLVPLESAPARALSGSVQLIAHEDSAYYGTNDAWNAEPGRR